MFVCCIPVLMLEPYNYNNLNVSLLHIGIDDKTV